MEVCAELRRCEVWHHRENHETCPKGQSEPQPSLMLGPFCDLRVRGLSIYSVIITTYRSAKLTSSTLPIIDAASRTLPSDMRCDRQSAWLPAERSDHHPRETAYKDRFWDRSPASASLSDQIEKT